MKFKMTFKRGLETIAEVEGREIDEEHLTVADLGKRVIEIEQWVDRVMGVRLHITTMSKGGKADGDKPIQS